MKKQDRENSKTLKNFMMSQDEYLRLVNKETEDIQCKFKVIRVSKRYIKPPNHHGATGNFISV